MGDSEINSLRELLVNAARDLRLGPTAADRAEAARRLGRSHSRVAVTYLIDALDDAAPEVRLAAVEALGEIRDRAAIEPLQSLLDRETSPLVSKDTIVSTIDELKVAGSASATERKAPKLENIALQAAARVSAEEDRQRLEELYRRAAEERQLIQAARRKSAEQTRRRAEEERARLQAEEEALARLTEELAGRRQAIEKARADAEAESHRV